MALSNNYLVKRNENSIFGVMGVDVIVSLYFYRTLDREDNKTNNNFIYYEERICDTGMHSNNTTNKILFLIA